MASDLLFGWVLGIFTIIIPYLMTIIYGLRKQLRFFTRTGPETAAKKKGLFDWLRKK